MDLESAVVPAPRSLASMAAAAVFADDDVRCLREWGTDTLYLLPQGGADDLVIGCDPACAVSLRDPQVSPRHARLVCDGVQWRIRAIGGAGLRQDGSPRHEVTVHPGVEIGLGRTTLVAESDRSMTLRAFCARLLGWDRHVSVDLALRALRLSVARRTPLLLRGQEDLVPVAYALHRRTLGTRAPFVVCDPRRQRVEASVRAPANHRDPMVALTAAAGGSLCIRSRRLPPDFPHVLAQLRVADPGVQLVICMNEDSQESHGPLASSCAIDVPLLATRVRELPRIIEECALDAMAELNAPESSFTAADHLWVRDHAATSLAEIEKATLRIVARRMTPGLTSAADRLGMASVSLSRWFGRRSTELPCALEGERITVPDEPLRAAVAAAGSSDGDGIPHARAHHRARRGGAEPLGPGKEVERESQGTRPSLGPGPEQE